MTLGSESRPQKVWQGAVVLTIAAVIIKVLSAFYRIPYQNIVGDVGFYIYQQVYPFYGIVIALATYGYPVVISKMIAERVAEQDKESVASILKISLYFLGIIGLIGFAVLYGGAAWIAQLMGDKQLIPLIQTISLSFLLLPFISTLRGYFQGQNNMVPTAVSQVAEQSVRVVTILVSAYFFVKSGRTMYEAGTGAIFGSLMGGFAALLFLTAYWFREGKVLKPHSGKRVNIDAKKIVFYLLVQGFTICVTNMMLTLIQLVDALSLFSLLVSNGVTEQTAKALKGVYDRGQPLVQLGTVAATSFSLTLVPLISAAKRRGDNHFIREKINLSLRVSIAVGLGAALGLACIIRPTNIMLFEDNSGALELTVLAVSVLFTSLSLTIAAILQGMGYDWIPVYAICIGLVSKWLCNVWLVPVLQTVGAAVATLVSYTMMASFLYYMLRKRINGHFIKKHNVYHIVISAFIMVVALQLYLLITDGLSALFTAHRLYAAAQALFGVAIGGGLYIIMVLKGNVFSKQELSLLPLGEKISIFLSKDNG